MEEPILKVSLKEYKKSIDDLRASLLSLDSASKEYKDTAEEIKDRQDKLNEVMSVGKKDADAVAGSYNALSQEMSKLKKEWKNMEIGTDAWKEMAVRINDLNDQLKDADAKVGVFSRNVGDYANAFGKAFDKAAEELGKIDGPLGAVFTTVKQLIPVIKSANGTAVKGLKGVKAALVSTGIGALIVAVGLLVTHWEDLMKLVRGTKGDVDAMKKSNEELSKTFESQNFNLEQQTKIMEAQGAEADELIKAKIQLIKTQIKEAQSQLEETRAAYKAIAAHTWLGRVLRGEQGDYKELQGLIEEQESALDSMTQKLTGLETDLTAYYERRKNEAKKAFNDERREAEKLLQSLEENNKTELQKLTEKYNKELALLKKHHKSTKLLTEQYNKQVAAINKKADQERLDALNNSYTKLAQYVPKVGLQNELKNAEAELQKFKDITNQDFPPKGLLETVLTGKELGAEYADFAKQAKEAGLIATDAPQEFANAWLSAGARVKTAIKEIVSYDAEMYDSIKMDYADYWHQRAQQGKDGITAELEFQESAVIAQYRVFEEAAKNASESEAAFYKAKMSELAKLSDDIGDKIDARAAELRVLSAQNDATLAGMNKDTSGMWNTTSFDDFYQKRIEAAQAYLDEIKAINYDSYEEYVAAYREAEQEVYDIQREYNQKKIQNYQELASSIGNVFGSIADIYQQDIESQKQRLIDQGKTEEEANAMLEDKFEQSKAFQIALSTINTISGAITAFMAAQELGYPWGLIIGAANAAAVTAAGIAEIQKIKSTTIGSTGTDAQSPQVTPRLAEYSPERTSNLTSASDTDNLANALAKQPVYVKVSDIDRAQKKVQVRDSESKF